MMHYYKTYRAKDKKAISGQYSVFSVQCFVLAAMLFFGGSVSAQVVVKGNVFGGGKLAEVGHGSKVTLNMGTAKIGTFDEESGALISGGDVYGGGEKAEVGTSIPTPAADGDVTVVNILQGTVGGNVYGGGLGVQPTDPNDPTTGKAADVHGAVTVTVSGGEVKKNVFGCNNLYGAPQRTVTVNIEGGEVSQDVFGGGQKADAEVSPVVNINGGSMRDVYGGGALAHTGANAGTTYVHVNTGTVTGNVYGGGLGDSPALGDGHTNVEALVNGNVVVNIGSGTVGANGSVSNVAGSATINGAVYGCNNVNGTPRADVTVNIFRTAHTTTGEVDGKDNNKYPTQIASADNRPAAFNALPNTDAQYALKEVFGGGNKAHYVPAASNTYSITVNVYGCEENTVQTIYGGGNAANVGRTGAITANTNLNIYGGRFDRVFGGGNGYSSTGNHTDDSQPNYNPGANINGTANTRVYGGLFNQIFGASNQFGNVGTVSLVIDKTPGCLEIIKESFGGANEADITGDVTTTLACSEIEIGTFYGGSNLADIIQGSVTLNVYGGTYGNVFGGSKGRLDDPNTDENEEKSADIDGDVTLNLFGGTMENAFGGSDVKGNITGSITVNMLDFGGDCGLQVNNVYGGGNLTEYNPTDPTNDSITVNIIHGTVSKVGDDYGNVFGGGYGTSATSHAGTAVNIGYDATLMGAANDDTKLLYSLLHDAPYTPATIPANYQATVDGSVYGSGYAANVTGNATVTMRKANSSASKLFGGGANAGVGGNTYVTLTDGTVYDGIFGGSDTTGTITGNTVIALNGGYAGTNAHPANFGICGGGWGLSTRVGGNVSVTLNGSTVYSDIYGGSYYGDVNTNSSNTTVVTLTSGSVDGNVYGGGFGDKGEHAYALVNGAVTVNANGATVNGNIFGCNNDNGAPQSTVTVNVTGGTIRSVLGGGNQASYGGTPVITVSGGTITKRVVGGGYAAGVGGSSIAISGGAIATQVDQPGCGIYGGCYSTGDVSGAIAVSVTGGTIGTDATHRANIHGGGYGEETTTDGTVTVNIGATSGGENPTYSGTATIYGDIYGGSALGEVSATGLLTQVNVYKGTVNGDIYGGGLGQKAVADDPDTPDDDESVDAIAAIVSGNVQVNIRGGVFNAAHGDAGGMVFGANNAHGTPKGNVTVNIYGTDHGDDIAHNLYPSPAPSTAAELATNAATQTYAIAAVYGGGNLASYTPDASMSATVHVYNCDNTIKDVYGGGNAANVGTTGVDAVPANTYVVIDGGRIHRVFGGGNGEVTPANTYGKATTTVNAGLIDQIFGCGNMQGSITETDLKLFKTGSCSDEVWGEVFGGANQAVLTGDLSTTIDCGVGDIGDIYGGSNKASIDGSVTLTIKGGTYANVYGGSKGIRASGAIRDTAADITGNVTLNLYGGHIDNAFGGSNANGTISGTITVNVDKDHDGNCADPWYVGNVYGGGNQAAYMAPTATTEAPSAHNYPEVNIIHGTVSGDVFGGGLGSTAIVTGNPKVTVNGSDATVSGSVYGGGSQAATTGDPEVTLTNGAVATVYGGGMAANVTGNPTVNINGGTVSTGIYGGCDTKGTVTGDIIVNITSNIGTSGSPLTEGIFGGGKGGFTDAEHPGTSTTGDVTVNIMRDGEKTPPILYADVYGGSAFGQVGASGKTAKVDLQAGTVNGTLYGGGKGDNNHTATVSGSTEVAVAGNVIGGVYGGCNVKGIVNGDVTVGITSGIIGAQSGYGSVYGGGLGANTKVKGSVAVTLGTENGVSGPTVNGDVYGGSAKGLVNCNEDGDGREGTSNSTAVTLYSGSVVGSLYGGGHGLESAAAHVWGPVTVAVTGGTVNNVFGCNNANGAPRSAVAVNISGGTVNMDVFGGGNLAGAEVGPVVTVSGSGEVKQNVFGGGNEAGVGAATVNINGGTIGSSTTNAGTYGIYGGCNTNGNVAGAITVNINAGVSTRLNGIFGGGFGPATTTSGSVDVVVNTTGTVNSDIYGGSAEGWVNNTTEAVNAACTTKVTLTSGTVVGDIYGGGLGTSSIEAKVWSPVTVAIGGGTVTSYTSGNETRGGNVFGCNNVKGAPQSTVEVNMTNGTVEKVFGGGNLATAAVSPVVTVSGGEVKQSIYGGGNEAGVGKADGSGITQVNISDGTIGTSIESVASSGVYGGCNTSGTVKGHIELNITGGTFGKESTLKGNTFRDNPQPFRIFGGGYGAGTDVTGNVTVNYGTESDNYSETPKLYGELYGGSALGTVNTSTSNTITVNILNGSFGYYRWKDESTQIQYQNGGNIFGGGLGEAGTDNKAKGQVNGVVHVNVGKNTNPSSKDPVNFVGAANLYNCSVYGCNNTNGSPKGDVYVDVYKTRHHREVGSNENEKYNDYFIFVDENGKNDTGSHFAIGNVYGGGNKANYESATSAADHNMTVGEKTHVYVHGCENTIEFIYGGCNAADAVGVMVEVEGGHFKDVFGGGNGLVTPANVGNGGAGLAVLSGCVNYQYGGCNMQGNINGPKYSIIKYSTTPPTPTATIISQVDDWGTLYNDTEKGYFLMRPDGYFHDCGMELEVETWFFGGNEAEIYSGLENTITCAEAGSYHYKNVFAGSRHASIYGDVKLTVEGGDIKNLFGGSQGYGEKPAHIRRYPTQAELNADTEHEIYSDGLRDFLALPENQSLIGSGKGGNIVLTVKGGKIGNIFGGNDVNGNVDGTITVNIEQDPTLDEGCQLAIDNVYGGSRYARYDPEKKGNATITSPIINLKNGVVGYDREYAEGEVHGCVFGGGLGDTNDMNSGVVTSNPKVYMDPAYWQPENKTYTFWVRGNIYGGGYLASVGAFDRDENNGLPTSCTEGTGKTTVEINGGKVGPRVLKMPKFRGHVFGGGKGTSNARAITPTLNYVNNTEVIIAGSALVKGSVYGGSENGHVLNNTSVKIQGGQIGCGWNNSTGELTDEQRDLNEAYDWNTAAEWRYECNSWPYEGDHSPYDKFAQFAQEDGYYYPPAEGESQAIYARGGKPTGSDGHTFYGNVFGGGSGYFPYAPGKWLWSAGAVYGNTQVEITGGHILTSVYGGNELTNVVGPRDEHGNMNRDGEGKLTRGVCKVTMSGGTLGVPRTEEQIKAHPVTCYLFGGGKGDQRSFFNTQTNVDSTYVAISDNALIYGSIFGGAEDGHVLGNTEVKVIGGTIGTRGTSYLDGNVFGGGRGFSGEALTEGAVCGNVDIEISGGTMKGSIYGGGRLASVGTYLVAPEASDYTQKYGVMQPDNGSERHGHIKIAIKGNAVIGHNNTNERYGGYVFAGCMGRLYKLDSTLNPNWSSLAKAKTTEVTVSENATVKRSVYGGGEFGFVDEQTTVNIAGGIVDSNVYGGGYGSLKLTTTEYRDPENATPEQIEAAEVVRNNVQKTAGRVYGNTEVNVTAGLVKGDIYGGGEMASVGTENVAASGNTEVNIGSGTVNTNTGLAESVSGSATIRGNVFGANNRVGSPRGNTRVNIYGTAQTTGTNDVTLGGISAFADSANFFQYVATDDAHVATAFALQNVYGAGNMANYTPVLGKSANVHIYGCRNTVRTVYGGGRAAGAGTSDGDTTTCNVTIDGGRIDTLFAGGDGHLKDANNQYLAADIYGNVNATVNGGFYTAVFGASNTAGVITGKSNLLVNKPVGCGNGEGTSSNGKEYIGVLFGGGNLANAESNVTLTVGCGVGSIHEVYGGCNLADIKGNVTLNLFGGTIDTAYGGSRGDIASLGTGHIDSTADITGNVTLNLYGGTINGEAFGGSNRNGNITGTITVNMNDQGVEKCGLTVHNIYGASNLADYTPTGTGVVSPQVNLLHGTVSKKDGVGGNVYGGAKGRKRESITYNATVTATPQVKVGYDGDMHIPDGITLSTSQVTVEGNVYGGGNLAPVAQGTRVTLQSKKKNTTTDTSIVNGNIFGGGSLANVAGATTVTLEGGRVALDVYGGGEKATTGNTNVTLTKGTVAQDIYGGGLGESGHAADVAVAAVYINGGAVRNVYGCNNVLGSPTRATVTVTNGTISQNVYGGGNLASTVGTGDDNDVRTKVNFRGGSAKKIFGGGHGIVDGENSKAADVGYSSVNITGGAVSEGVYGGCDENGTVNYNDTVNITGGTFGADNARAEIFGGGLGNATSVTGNVAVSYGSISSGGQHTTDPLLYGDLYGGSAYGVVNNNSGGITTNTTVTALNGTIYGNVYGGGKGDATAGHENWGNVNGVVRVNIGNGTLDDGDKVSSSFGKVYIRKYSDTQGGCVYGGNNIGGSPQDNVFVNIWQTHQGSEEEINETGFAIDQVFGGGNEASFPNFTSNPKKITTRIYGCDNTIRRVFGGGNAAAVPNVELYIDGGRFDYGWGGGNGELGADHAADVNGTVKIVFSGVWLHELTGGSNANGTISGGAPSLTSDPSKCGAAVVEDLYCGSTSTVIVGSRTTVVNCGAGTYKNIYGGSKLNDYYGNIKIILNGAKATNVYGGCNQANVKAFDATHNPDSIGQGGNVEIVLRGGTFDNVYGGCNISGSVEGKITITVDSTAQAHDSCNLVVHNIYGAGKDAAYTPTTSIAGTDLATPRVNVFQGSVTKKAVEIEGETTYTGGNVYGGGYGSGATVTANPVVTIGDVAHTSNKAIVRGSVFGGGEEAAVSGNTTVNILQGNTLTGTVYGGGNLANVSGNVDVVIGNTTTDGPTIDGDVYGGGALAHTGTSGHTDATTYHNNVTLNKGTINGNIYGGGLGKTGTPSTPAYVYGPVQVKVYGGTTDSVFGCNNILGSPQSTVNVDVYGTENTPKALKAVFGGGNRADASVSPTVTVHNCDSKIGTVYGGGNAAKVPATNVTVYGGSIDTVFGGGNGRVKKAPVAGASTVKIHGGSIGQVFGGNNVNGYIEDTISVTIEQKGEGNNSACSTMEIGNVYGGGNLAVYAPSTAAAHGTDKFSPKVFIISGNIEGSVYGGGKGIDTSLTAGMVRSNTLVDMQGGTVKRSIYGGGELASVGNINNNYNGCEPGTGLTKVLISGGVVGNISSARMPSSTDPEGDEFGYVFAGGKGVVDSVIYGNANKANKLALVDSTYLEISDSALITASVYGGCENGMVLRNTHVKISGGQIGIGYDAKNNTWDAAYTKEQWAAAKNAVTSGNMGNYTNPFHECDHFPYGVTEGGKTVYKVYDIFAGDGDYNPAEASKTASNGHSFYGNVFGGGSGYYPFWHNGKSVWRRTAGRVKGNTKVEITGGHILTSVYGGNEYTDVLGHCTVKMSGGTLGVPRSLDSIAAHPVTCYLFGAGMGDPRAEFNTWTMVDSVYVEVSGGIIYGSVFGGGEDGHVKGNVNVVVKDNAFIGTWGTSYVDGNVFGGGRGFKGDVLTAGVVAGNVTVDIQGGTMLGSIYGGGRLASVGTYLVPVDNSNYGQLMPDDGNNTHGYITVNISGGVIGNSQSYDVSLDHSRGGNVFGGCMGRLTQLDGSYILPRWQDLGKAYQTNVNIYGDAVVKGNVYGGSELGTVEQNATVKISGNAVIGNLIEGVYRHGNVYGGGYGNKILSSDNLSNKSIRDSVPLFAGLTYRNTNVEVTGNATVGGSVFGGGDLASVGTPGTPVFSDGLFTGFTSGTGTTTVTVRGGTVGPIDDNHQNGHVYGGGRGQSSDDYRAYSNVASTSVTVSGGQVMGDVYGGGADAHVLGNTIVKIDTGANIGTNGTDNHNGNVFGGGRGSGTVTDNNFVLNQTCGRVGGNTSVTMDGGSILGSIFGGGRMALVGVDQNGELTGFIANNNYQYEQHGKATIEVKGNASIGTTNSWELLRSDHSVGDIFGSGKGDVDYYNSVEAGRVMNTQIIISGSPAIRGSVFGGGEMAGIGWWDTEGTNKGKFYANTGVSTISISKTPTIGTADEFNLYAKPTHNEQSQRVSPENPGKWTIYDGTGKLIHTCTGNVFGGSQGDADIESLHWVSMGRSKTATVTVSGGTIMGEVFGGAEQGVMTGSPVVTISDTSAVIGTVITNANNGLADYNFGSVYGGGYGSDNHTAHTTDSSNVQRAVQIAGRVYGNTSVSMTGGTVKANVYGGGSYASVGNITFDANSNMATGCSSGGTPTVTISGGTVEGNVFGSSRGDAIEPDVNNDDQAWVKSTSVTVSGTNTRVKGNVFGGGENGHVLTNAVVTINGGTIGYTATEYTSLTDEQKAQDFPLRGNVYGAGSGMDKYNNSTYNPKGGVVMGNTKVTINSGYISRNVYGAGAMASVGDATRDNTHTPTPSWPYKYSHAQNTGKAEVIVNGGHIGTVANPTLSGDVYGSARGAAGDRMEMGRLANVRTTDVTVNFTPADEAIANETEKVIVGSVYGSGENGHVYADAVVTLTNGLVGGSVFGGGKGTDTYGSGNIHSITAGKVYGNTYVNINGGRVNNNVYGGGNMASVGKGNYNGYGESGVDTTNTGHCYVNIYGGTVGVDGNENGHVFGAGKGFAFVPVENPTIDNCPDFFMSYANKTYVTIGNPGDNASDPKVKGSVFGGSENGHVRYDAYVQVNRGEIGVAYTRDDSLAGTNPNTSNLWTFRGNVYGAGRGMGTYKDAQNNDQYNVTAGSVGRNTRIDINGGTVHRNVLGGGSLASVGQPMGGFDAEESSTCIVNINTTIGGTYANKYSKIDYGGYVGGGSRGLSSPDAGPSYADFAKCANTQVNINIGGVLPHSLYGGGEYGQVTGNTEVNILGGKVHSSIYGGGKGAWGETGHANDQASGLVQGNTVVNLESGEAQYVYGGSRMANIMGDATVNVGKNDNGTYEGEITVTGAIYGCNNKNGSPKGDATVHVWKTKRTTEQETTGAEYAIPSVFGGGHQADYSPSETTKRARVIVHGCENTIGVVYGGGDAADAYGVGVEIDGGRFNQVFGGGNGYSATDNHTNPNAPNYNPGANVGAGGTETQIHGGSINQLFGGSNAYGNISGQMNTIVDNASGCSEHIGEFFGGGNKVPISGDIVTTIGCGTVFDTVYGGSNQAGITGNVTLNIKGGRIGGVYGGSKGVADNPNTTENEAVSADIMDNTTTDAVEGNVTLNLYGGTMDVAFGGSNINGNIDGFITVNVLDHELASPCEPLKVRNIYGAGNITPYTPKSASIESPVVNVMHIKVGDTISGDVFGGGKGSTAIVTANPKVTIGYDATTMASLKPSDYTQPTGFPRAVVAGKVFGGGDLADVAGTATVRVQKGNSRVPYVYGGGNAAAVEGTQVFVSGGTITDVYGGGRGDEEKAAMVNGPGTVTISGGRMDKAFAGGHHNGGITGAINLHVEKSSAEGADALYIGELYGGGNLANGRAGNITIAGTGIWTTNHDNHNATDNRIGYELEGIGVVYGGANEANVGTEENPSPITLTINNGIVENVFGGNNQSGTIYGRIEVNIQKTGADDTWYVGTVFGGGNVAPYGDTTEVNVKAGTVTYNVYGGGNNIRKQVNGQDVYGAARGKVNVSGGTVTGDVYGGCNTSGTIKEGTRVTLTDGTVRTVYGGGLGGNTHVKGGSKVDISGNAQITSDVFGGGNQGSVEGGANVKIH